MEQQKPSINYRVLLSKTIFPWPNKGASLIKLLWYFSPALFSSFSFSPPPIKKVDRPKLNSLTLWQKNIKVFLSELAGFDYKIPSMVTLSSKTLSTRMLSITTVTILTLTDNQHNDAKHNNNQYNDTEHKTEQNRNQQNDALLNDAQLNSTQHNYT
jgi:hypothetical protein